MKNILPINRQQTSQTIYIQAKRLIVNRLTGIV
jgi:hypothetical protein